MEPITSTSSFIRFIHLVLLLRKLSKTRSAYPKLPPGPKTLPIIGNIHQLSGSQPHRALTDLAKKHGQVMHLQRGEVSTVVISSAQMAKEALKTHDVALVNRPRILAAQTITYNFQDVSFSPYGGYWRQMRKMCPRAPQPSKCSSNAGHSGGWGLENDRLHPVILIQVTAG